LRDADEPAGGLEIADIERLCRVYGLTITAPRHGSHYKVRDPKGSTTLTIPARRPIKGVYIRAPVALAKQFGGGRTHDISLPDNAASA